MVESDEESEVEKPSPPKKRRSAPLPKKNCQGPLALGPLDPVLGGGCRCCGSLKYDFKKGDRIICSKYLKAGGGPICEYQY